MSRNLNIIELRQKIKAIYDKQKLVVKMGLKREVFFRKMAIYRSLVTLNFFPFMIS